MDMTRRSRGLRSVQTRLYRDDAGTQQGEEHRELFANAGHSDIQVIVDPGKGWICAMGRKL